MSPIHASDPVATARNDSLPLTDPCPARPRPRVRVQCVAARVETADVRRHQVGVAGRHATDHRRHRFTGGVCGEGGRIHGENTRRQHQQHTGRTSRQVGCGSTTSSVSAGRVRRSVVRGQSTQSVRVHGTSVALQRRLVTRWDDTGIVGSRSERVRTTAQGRQPARATHDRAAQRAVYDATPQSHRRTPRRRSNHRHPARLRSCRNSLRLTASDAPIPCCGGRVRQNRGRDVECVRGVGQVARERVGQARQGRQVRASG